MAWEASVDDTLNGIGPRVPCHFHHHHHNENIEEVETAKCAVVKCMYYSIIILMNTIQQ